MSSIITNSAAMNALTTLRNINNSLTSTQDRVSSGLKVSTAKDNAAYFSISETMNSDSSLNKSVNEGMTLAKNSVATARLGVEAVVDLAKQYIDRQTFAVNLPTADQALVREELVALAAQMQNILDQSNFNGEDLVTATAGTKTVTTGLFRGASALEASTLTLTTVDVSALVTALIPATATFDAAGVNTSRDQLDLMIAYATDLGITEKAIENQQSFLATLTDRLDSGIGGMVDADMEAEAARLQALQVQQQLATQSLAIANQNPQNILSLFR
jgi:flagellin